ncbi:MAG: hypothetical protein E7191_07075 [Erysipelotrichaceae bacterium]|nr:hypothetical protein [Erysipelotrichaceae bacterium]
MAKKIVKKKVKRARRNTKLLFLNMITILLMASSTAYLVYILNSLQMIPQLWLILGAIILVALFLLNCILALLKIPSILQYIRCLVILAISVVMFYGTYTVQSVDRELEQVMKLPSEYHEYVSIITLRENAIYSSTDLKNKRVGYQSTIDTEHMDLALEYLEDQTTIQKTKYRDYNTAVADLMAHKVDAIIVSESYRPLIQESYSNFDQVTAKIDAYEIQREVTDIAKSIDVTKNSFTVFISGIDTLGKATLNSQSDVNMLVTVNPLSQTISMMTIPRDSYLPNACLAYENDKLTNTGAFGIDCTVRTIENAFGVDINYYAKVSFSSIIDAVNALGGLEVNVPYSFCERKANRVDIIYVYEGKQVLNGEQALALARNRKNASGGDVGRGKNQQMLVNAAIRQFASSDILKVTEDLLEVVNSTVQTNMTKKEIYAFINSFASDLGNWTINNYSAGGEIGWGECASMPGVELSIVNLKDEEMKAIKYMIKSSLTDSDLSEFSFTVNDVTVEEVKVEGETQGASGQSFCWITEEYKKKQETSSEENVE